MSCINAYIAFTPSIGVSVRNVTKGINANVSITKNIIVFCSLVCGVHNSMNVLTNNGKILFDGDKLLLI